jgi:hypothetical protein
MIDEALPTLQSLLGIVCQAELARRIGRSRGFVWRLCDGRPLKDDSLIEPLARAIHQDVDFIRRVVENDRKRARLDRKGSAA